MLVHNAELRNLFCGSEQHSTSCGPHRVFMLFLAPSGYQAYLALQH